MADEQNDHSAWEPEVGWRRWLDWNDAGGLYVETGQLDVGLVRSGSHAWWWRALHAVARRLNRFLMTHG